MLSFLNKILGVRGDIVKVEFEVEDKKFTAWVPDDELLGSVKDILLNREYEYLPEFELKNFRDGIIIDAGAHVGLFSLVASVYAKKVIAIEANPINYKLLELNLMINNVKNVIPINKALWIKDNEKIKLYIGEHSGGHSIYEKSDKYFEVETITLNRIIKDFNLEKVDLLKIDVEGAEFEIFENLDKEIADKIEKIVGEIHLNYGDFDKLISKLKELGFGKIRCYHPPIYRKESYKIRNLIKLKLIRNTVYFIANLLKFNDKTLNILFISKKYE